MCDGTAGREVHPVSSAQGSEVQTPGGWLALNARVSPALRVPNNSCCRIWLLAWRYCLLGAVCQFTVYVSSYLYQLGRGWKSTQLIAGFRLCCLTLGACDCLYINTFELFLGFLKPLRSSLGHWKRYISNFLACHCFFRTYMVHALNKQILKMQDFLNNKVLCLCNQFCPHVVHLFLINHKLQHDLWTFLIWTDIFEENASF